MSNAPCAFIFVPVNRTEAFSTTVPESARSPSSSTVTLNSDGTGSTSSKPSGCRNERPAFRGLPPVVTTTVSNHSAGRLSKANR